MNKYAVRPRILFLADKWCAGRRDFGVSEWETNLYESLNVLDIANVEVFHFDDFYINHMLPGDKALLIKISQFMPDIIVLIIYKMPSSDFNVPTWETLSIIRDTYKIPMIAIWGDLEIPEQVKISKSLLPYVMQHYATASEAALRRINNSDKYSYVWVPKNPRIFCNRNVERDIEISYVGSTKNSRLARINHLKKNGIPVYHGGGEREEHFTTVEYARLLQRSKIALSFSRASYSHVVNARPFEAMLCGAMLLEEESFEMPKLFIPFIDFVPYTSRRDLLKKANYFLHNENHRESIALKGQEKANNLYSSEKFWELIFGTVLEYGTSGRYALSLNKTQLYKLSKWRAFRLKILNGLCSSNLGFELYKVFIKFFSKEYWKNQLLCHIWIPFVMNLKKRLPVLIYTRLKKMKDSIY